MLTSQKKLLVTGGAGFIGSNFVEQALEQGFGVIVFDSLTYAGHRENLKTSDSNSNFAFVKGDICDAPSLKAVFSNYPIDAVVHFAAESHVDRSIGVPAAFIKTNILGTYQLLASTQEYWSSLSPSKKEVFRYLQISTDEVYGSLGLEERSIKFTEKSAYCPRSPYSASKAAGDHIALAWHHTYGLPTLVTNCSNNYGPKQYPEKLIPCMIQSALGGEILGVYGKGENVRDWIHVRDHCKGVLLALEKGRVGETYCFGGNAERSNLEVVQQICQVLDRLKPLKGGRSYSERITFVPDRLGHDLRYAIDDSKAIQELGFRRHYDEFEEGLVETIHWYLSHQDWVKTVMPSIRTDAIDCEGSP